MSGGLGSRLLDESYSAETRRHVVQVTVARLVTNACYRFAPPFLASISDDFEISLTRLGVALMITELFMALAPLLGAVVDRIHRRTAMVVGLAGVSGSATLAAASPAVWTFAIAITILGLAKFIFDGGMTAWVNDHVDYERRGRVVGITETSWALGLLIGVTLMGLLASATSWRWGYVAGAISVMVMALVLSVRLVEPEQGEGRNHRAAMPATIDGDAVEALDEEDVPIEGAGQLDLRDVEAAGGGEAHGDELGTDDAVQVGRR